MANYNDNVLVCLFGCLSACRYLSDEYKDNDRFWCSKSGSNESNAKPSFSDISKAKACILAKASESSSKAKVQASRSKTKVQASMAKVSRSKAEASPKTLIVKRPVPITNCVLGHANAKTWDAILSKTFRVKIPSTITCADEKKGKRKIEVMMLECIVLSSDSSDDSKGPSIANVPKEGPSIASVSKEGPSTQGLLDWYGYDTVEEYLEKIFFPSTDKDSTDEDTTDNDSTDEDTINESYSPKSKGKYVPVSQKHNPKVIFKSPILIKGCVLGLANVHTWDDILKKFGVRKPESCVDNAKGKRKLAIEACICSKHLQVAFALHLQLASEACICMLLTHLLALGATKLIHLLALAATQLNHLLAFATTKLNHLLCIQVAFAL
ncbi:hypothetical protein Tco_0214226 [Tanacetum coccineum]